jgi:GNAT superfamily N-acetyltransferase
MRIFNKFNRVYELYSEGGVSRVLEQTFAYVRYHTKEKWRFVYFELDLTANPYSLPEIGSSMAVRRAKPEDIEKIITDIYPYMGEIQEFDKQFIERVGDSNYECFITEKDCKLVSYLIVFKKANQSPLMKMPFKKKLITESDACLGSAFTVPDARGMWIIPHVLLTIIDYLQKESSALRILLLMNVDTPGALGFYKRLGFKIIENAAPKGLFSKILQK